ncbi:MAG: hypothetical protein IIY55_05050 [Blautia sp.]|nr:hypothetical protein [Blautia sp.]
MAMNPLKLLSAKKQFEKRHARVAAFIEKELMVPLPEGTILELSVTRPGEAPVTTNMKITEEDLQFLKDLK